MSYTIDSTALSKSGLTASQLNTLVAGTGLANLGQAFLDVETDYGLNALFVLAHAAVESAWGNSYLAQNRNSLFGLNAYDSNPDAATGYPTKYDSVMGYGKFMSQYYLHQGNPYYAGPTFGNIFVHYSTAGQAEAQTIVGIMNYELQKLGSNPAPTPTPSPSPAPSGNQVVVKSGDTLSGIAAQHGLSLAQIEALNPQIKDFNVIHPGDVVNIGGEAPTPAPAPAPAPSGRTYVVQSGDNLSGIAQKFGISLATIESLNPQITNPDKIYPGEVVNVGGSAPAPAPAPSSGTVVTIASGDTLWALSQKYGTSIGQIVAWNQGKYPSMTANYIQAGWSIRVR